jgi:hypothetical protein
MSGPDLEDRLDHLLRSVAAGVAPSGVEAVARRGRRRRMARRAAGGGLIAVLLAGVVLAKVVLPEPTSPPTAAPVATGPAVGGVPDGVVSWSGGREGDGPRQLSVTVLAGGGVGGQPSDPCWEGYRSEARSEPDRVVVTVHRFRSRVSLAKGRGCAAIGRIWNVTVPLPDQLGGRPVVDGATGQPKPIAEGPLIADWLPYGWIQQTEPGSGGALWQREYEPAPTGRPSPNDARLPRIAKDGLLALWPADHVTVATVPPGLLETWNRRPGTLEVAPVLVRGVRARVEWNQADRLVTLRWREGDRAYVVVGHGSDGAGLRNVQALVVSLARGLRRLCEPTPPLETSPIEGWEPSGARPDQSGCR